MYCTGQSNDHTNAPSSDAGVLLPHNNNMQAHQLGEAETWPCGSGEPASLGEVNPSERRYSYRLVARDFEDCNDPPHTGISILDGFRPDLSIKKPLRLASVVGSVGLL